MTRFRDLFTPMSFRYLTVAVLVALVALVPLAAAGSFQDAFGFYSSELYGLSGDATATRKLQQDSSVCGIDEYFCGDSDLISDTAYNAVVAGNCYNDSADTGKVRSLTKH